MLFVLCLDQYETNTLVRAPGTPTPEPFISTVKFVGKGVEKFQQVAIGEWLRG